VAAALGIAALAAWFTAMARGSRATRLRDEPVHPVDRACIALSVAVTALTIGGAAGGWLSLKYNPFAGLPWPEFSPAGAAIALSCAWPAARLALLPEPRPAARAEEVTLTPGTVQP
jgi:hypothetical protein